MAINKKEITISIQSEDFDVQTEIDLRTKNNMNIGGVVTFIGLVRDISESLDLEFMELEHYPGMTEKVLEDICDNALDKWSLQKISIIHRVGMLHPGDKIVLVLVASSHRREAFQAADFIMDFLKSKAPFWKKETRKSSSYWVDKRSEDDDNLSRWSE
jgi:molybdopterin synthase catalytic subunit